MTDASPLPAPPSASDGLACFVDPIGVALLDSLTPERAWIHHRDAARSRHVAIFVHDGRTDRTLRVAGTIVATARTETGWWMTRIIVAPDQFDVRELISLSGLS